MKLIDLDNPCKVEIELNGYKCSASVIGKLVDAVPVVRCKDCKHRPMKRDPNGDDYGFNLYSPTDAEICPCIVGDNWYSWTPQDNFYCAYGERKEGNV